ncbi:MAG: SusC/RagA family TonB-linked outer membrane protein [Flavobacteriaceae bacterium]|jgi:TonB-linked SusC/RagA family outer membrane protein|nr:SusC/RagA family TonB-linked outer membrane protein [Flavobacteriaceae bacterium]
MKINKKFLGFAFLLVGSMLWAQVKTVTGTVTDSKGDPQRDALVTVQGTGIKVYTDANGQFTVQAEKGQTIKVESLDEQTNSFVVGDQVSYVVSVKSQGVSDLDEVIVVGYSRINRQDFVGTADKVDITSVGNKSVSTVSQALSGEIAGVRVINTSGQPGTDATIRIRGFSSANGDRSPLYVLDGAPYSGNISAINPEDIGSLVILKDATATAIYGARGANGVVLITTKRGNSRKPLVQIESKIGVNVSLLPRYSTIKSPESYIELSWEALKNQGYFNGVADPVAYANQYLFSTRGIRTQYNMWNVANASELIDPVTGKVREGVTRKYDPENWEDYAFQSAIRTENNFSISGGEGKFNYYTNLGYLKDEGYSINSQFERYSGRLNLDYQPKDWLKGEFNIGYAHTKSKNNGQTDDSGSIFWFVDNIPSIYPLFSRDADGNKILDTYYDGYKFDYGTGRGFGALTNAIADATYGTNNYFKHEINSNFFLEAKIFDFLKFETRLSGQYSNRSRDVLDSPYYGSSASEGGSIYKTKLENFAWTFLQLLRFNKRYGKHGVEAFVAHETNSEIQQYLSAYKTGLIRPEVPEFNNAINSITSSSYKLDYMLESYFAQINYDYDNKYLASFTVRRDGSSRYLYSNDKWGTFASVGLGWVLSKENFLQGNNFFKYLKLKASYGTNGSQALFVPSNAVSGTEYYYPGYPEYNYGNFSGLIATPYVRHGSPYLTWETVRKTQGGIEFSLFKTSVIEGTIDLYHDKTYDLIFDNRLAPSTGDAVKKVNGGALVNKGLEFNLIGHIIKKNDFYFDLSINGEFLKNKLTQMPIDDATGERKIIDLSEAGFGRAKGKSLYDFYMREWAGVNPETGAAQWYVNYVDTNKNGQYDADEHISSLYDYQKQNPDAVIEEGITEVYADATQRFVNKSAIPDIRGAVNLLVGYKGFSLSVQMLYSIGGYSYDYTYAGLMSNQQVGGNNWATDIYDRWQQPGDITNVPRLTSNRTGDTSYNTRSTRFLTKSDYFLLNNVTLGYSMPKPLLTGLGVEFLQFTLSGDNLWIHSKRKGFNPSTAETGASDTYRYTPLSTFTFGVKVGL